MNISRMKALLKRRKIRFMTKMTRKKIEIHGLDPDEVMGEMKNPVNLEEVVKQQARLLNDKSYKLYFRITKRKVWRVVIVYKVIKKNIFIITAFPENRKIEKKIVIPKVRRKK